MDHDQYNTPAVLEPVATSPDLSRQAATDDDFISIKEVQQIFEAHGRSVTERTLQRYCENKHMVGTKRLTAEGQKWFVTKSSVYTRLKELDEFDRLRVSRQVATSPDMSASVAHEKQEFFSDDNARQAPTDTVSSLPVAEPSSHTTADDTSRPVATSRDVSGSNETVQQQFILESIERERKMYETMLEQYKDRVEDLVKDKSALQSDKEMLVQQLRSKDTQIDRFFNSERDTKTLLGSLQSLMNAIWPKVQKGSEGDRYVPLHDALGSGLDQHEHRSEEQP